MITKRLKVVSISITENGAEVNCDGYTKIGDLEPDYSYVCFKITQEEAAGLAPGQWLTLTAQ